MIRRLSTVAAALLVSASLLSATGSAAPRGPQDPAVVPLVSTCVNWYAPNALGQVRTITSNDASLYTSTAFVNMQCGGTAISLAAGRRALITTRVDAEVTCTGADGQWCIGRVLVGGLEAQPNAPEPDSFSWANSEPNAAQWESNAFTRTTARRCAATIGACLYPVQVQVRNHAPDLLLRVDDSTVAVTVTYY